MKKLHFPLSTALLATLLAGDIAAHRGAAQTQSPAPAPAATPAVLTAREFCLVDAQGHTTALLHNTDAGLPLLSLYDKKQRVRLVAGVAEDGASFGVLNADGGAAVEVSSGAVDRGAETTGSVIVHGRKQSAVQIIGGGGGTGSGLVLLDSAGKPVGSLAYSEALRGAGLALGGSGGKGGFAALNAGGKCQITVQNAAGKVIWRQP